jgi:hypothetical protein
MKEVTANCTIEAEADACKLSDGLATYIFLIHIYSIPKEVCYGVWRTL